MRYNRAKREFSVKFESQEAAVPVADSFTLSDLLLEAHIDGQRRVMQLISRSVASGVTLQYLGTNYHISVLPGKAHQLLQHMPEKKVVDTSSVIIAPMPGLVKSVAVEVGQKVSSRP